MSRLRKSGSRRISMTVATAAVRSFKGGGPRAGGSGGKDAGDNSDTASLSSRSSHVSSAVSGHQQDRGSRQSGKDSSNGDAQNILVAVRVRPGLPKEPPEIHEHLYDIVKEGPLPMDAKKLAFDTNENKVSGRKDYDVVPHAYYYDTTFGPTASNPDVYAKSVKPVVDSVLEGYHATIFAYGMTGSGKTHTMVGNRKDPGMIPLSFEQIFKQVEASQEHTTFKISISYLEIYCEMVRDIIDPSRDNLDIRESKENGVYIQGVSQHVVTSWKETKELLDQGMENRAVTATEMNAESSRSHAVLVARVTRENKVTQERSQAKLFLVDLAGSERIGKSGVTGVALEEAKAINLSLSTLGLCIKALVAANKPHVPFRSSKLTRLLRESLGGKARTCLIIAVRPGQPHIEETLSALQFGARARKIKVHASKNVHKNWKLECEKLQLLYDQSEKEKVKLRKRVSALKRKLHAGEGGSDYSSSDDDEDLNGEQEHDHENIEQGRRASLVAATAKKSKLKIQMKEMQRELEAKIAEAKTNYESKDAEIEGLQLQIREQKKHTASMTTLVESLQEEVFNKDLELTEIRAAKQHLESELEALEEKSTQERSKFTSKSAELTLALKHMKSDLDASHEELRVCELELRRAGADNQVLREKISEAEGLHNAELGQMKISMRELKRDLHSKTSKFKAQMRAAEHRYREIVRALHKKEEETKDLVATVKAVEQRLSARVKEVERGRKAMLIERSHSDRLARIVSMVRAQVLKLHVNAGSGADRALQRVPFHFSSNENTREQQLRLEYGIEKKGQTNSSDEDKRDTKLEPNSDESGTSVLDKFENALCTSMAKLVSDLRVCAREEEQKRWCNERARYLKTIALAEREKALLKEESEKQRERTEYALNLVKAVKPLVDGMQSL
eukprot:g3807.t1